MRLTEEEVDRITQKWGACNHGALQEAAQIVAERCRCDDAERYRVLRTAPIFSDGRAYVVESVYEQGHFRGQITLHGDELDAAVDKYRYKGYAIPEG